MRLSRRAATGLVAAASLVVLSGCGVADARIRPGAAATVDGTTISLSDVDDTTTAVCAYLSETQPEGFQPYPRVLQRQNGVTTLVERVAFEALLEERDLTLPDTYRQQLAAIETQYADEDPEYRDALIELSNDNAFVSSAATVVGDAAIEAEGTVSGSPDESVQRGLAEAFAWLADHDVDVNPVFDLRFGDDGPVQDDSDVSIAVSDAARSGEFDLQDPEVAQQISQIVASLPADQVCGV